MNETNIPDYIPVGTVKSEEYTTKAVRHKLRFDCSHEYSTERSHRSGAVILSISEKKTNFQRSNQITRGVVVKPKLTKSKNFETRSAVHSKFGRTHAHNQASGPQFPRTVFDTEANGTLGNKYKENTEI